MSAGLPLAATLEDVQDRVLDVIRGLASELSGDRAVRATTATASLERDIGLGSLERVELLLRLETEFGRSLDEGYLRLDTPRALAKALLAAGCALPTGNAPRLAVVAASAFEVTAPTVHGVLWQRAQADPDRPHVYMREEDGAEHTVTYGSLLAEAAGVAGGLRERGVRRGDRVALMLPTGLDFLRTFQGILIAGAIPVPIYPPVRLDRLDEYAARQGAILADAGVTALVTIPRALPIAALLQPRVPSLACVTTATELVEMGASWPSPEGSGRDAAFIQYTSGSTGAPKGVLLTHDNLLANVRAISAGLEARPTDVGASWLPLYHDMGLIGSWLFCMHDGLPIAIQSPLSFLSRPERWLWTIHQRRATLSAAPNFAYELCVRKIPDAALEGLDLSSWRCALNGAEPVNPDTLDRFARRFEPYGFRRDAMFPVYGLAENSVAVCFPPVGREPRVLGVDRAAFTEHQRAVAAPAEDDTALQFVSVGSAVPGHEVRILDDGGATVADGLVGRIVFRGPSATSGYFLKPEATAALQAGDGFLDSGDLGFVAGGEVYVTGRRKDLVIKGGRNFVPQEIEEVASTVEGVRKGCVVAIGVPHEALGTETLVIVAETRARSAEARARIEAAIVERVTAAIGVPPDTVALVPPGAVPKTSSGKVRRAETRDLFRSGDLGQPSRMSAARRASLLLAAARGEAARRLRVVPRAAYAFWLAAAALVLVPPLALVAMVVPGERRARAFTRFGAAVLLRAGLLRLSVEGASRLPAGARFVLAANHTSYLDVPTLLALLPVDFVFVAKKEVDGWPVIGPLLRRCRHLLVDRDAAQGVSDASVITDALRQRSVLLFPEGTFTPAAGLRPFRLGAFKAAVETGTAVVPLALRGSRQVLRDGQALPRPGRIRLWVGEPIEPDGSDWAAILRLRDRVADAIASECGEPRLDLVSGGPAKG